MGEPKHDPSKLIEKDEVLGFQRTNSEFEAVTNFKVAVAGYVADEGNVIGYIINMDLKVTDPLEPSAKASSKRFYLTNSCLGNQGSITAALSNQAVWIAQSKEPFLPQYLYKVCTDYLKSQHPKRFRPVKIIGKQPNEDTWVLNKDLQLNVRGQVIPKAEQRFVFLDNNSQLEPLHQITDIDNGESLKVLFEAERGLFGNNYPQVLLLHAASALAANYELVVNEFMGCALPVAIGSPVSGKSTALKAVLSPFGIKTYSNECTKKFIETKQCWSTIPFGWDDVSNLKVLGEIAVSSYNQGGSASVRGMQVPHTVPIVTTNLDTAQLKYKSRWFLVKFESPDPALKGKELEKAERELRKAMETAFRSCPILTTFVYQCINDRLEDVDYEERCDDKMTEIKVDGRARRMFTLLLYITLKILQKVGLSDDYDLVEEKFCDVILPSYVEDNSTSTSTNISSSSTVQEALRSLPQTILQMDKNKALQFFENDVVPTRCGCGHVVAFHVQSLKNALKEAKDWNITENAIRHFIKKEKIGCIGKQLKFRERKEQVSAAHIERDWFVKSDIEKVDKMLGMRRDKGPISGGKRLKKGLTGESRLSGQVNKLAIGTTAPVAPVPVAEQKQATTDSSGWQETNKDSSGWQGSSNTTEPKKGEEANGSADKEELKRIADSSLISKLLRNKLVNKNEVEIMRKDPNSPLYSVKSFEELPLSNQLRKGVYEMGFNKPSKIQETALPMLLADPPNNMIVQSQSGTGKTAAFVLTMLSRVDATKQHPQVLCLSPTYELAMQIGKVAEQMGKYCTHIRIACAVRGSNMARGQKCTSQIIIGTPGTVLDWIRKLRIFDPKKIRVFVLNEANIFIALQGHQDQLIRVQKGLPNDCQTLLFSATYDDEVMSFAHSVVTNPIEIRLRREEESLDNIKQYYVMCRNQEDKFEALCNMYGVLSIGQCMVFCMTRKNAAWLAAKMVKEGHATALLSGEITIDQRLAVINRFREGKEKLLITTNVSARGIDIEQVTLVVNYDMPYDGQGRPDFETYLHRIGRTGRFGKSGIAVNFIDGQRSLSCMKRIEEHFGRQIVQLKADDVDELEKLN